MKQAKPNYSFKIKEDSIVLLEALAPSMKNYSKQKIKQITEFGGVWLTRNKKKKRIKKVKFPLIKGDLIEVFVLKKYEPFQNGIEIKAFSDWSIWYKPAGLLSVPGPYGDKGSIQFQVQQKYLQAQAVHRLDRETSGLIIFAHSKNSMKYLSKLLQERKIKKKYLALAYGHISNNLLIDTPLDRKDANTHLSPLVTDNGNTWLVVSIETGRFHQIRRHLNSINHPIIGDPKYGTNNKNDSGLKLIAYSLEIDHNEYSEIIRVQIPQEHIPLVCRDKIPTC